MTTEINQNVQYSSEFLHSPPSCQSTSSKTQSNPCDDNSKESEFKTRRLIPVQRTYNECILYALGEWRCACLTIVLVTGIILISSCGVKQLTNYVNSSHSDLQYTISYHKHEQSFKLLCQTSSLLIVSGLLFLIYLIYLIESWQSRNWIQTTWLIDTKMAYNLINNAHRLIPSILWQIKCYHYAHNTPQYTNYQQNPIQQSLILNEADSNKPTKYPFIQDDDFNKSTRGKQTLEHPYPISSNKLPDMFSHASCNPNVNQIKCHRIITMNKICSFDLSKIDALWDMSDNISELENFQLIEMNLSTLFSFSDKQTYLEYQRQKQEFFTTYEKFDVYMETEQICTFADFIKFPEQFLIIHRSSKLPVYLKGITYLIATLLLCSFPLRIFIYANKAKLHCKIHKIFGPKPINGNLYNSIKLIPLHNQINITSNVLKNTISTHTNQSMSMNQNLTDSHTTNHILNHTNDTNKPYHINNEAVVLFNKYISENTTDFNRTRTRHKRRNQYQLNVSKDLDDSNHFKYDKHNHDVDDHGHSVVTEDEDNDDDDDDDDGDDDDDDELLSLDIRFDEYIKNKCAKNDRNKAEHNCYTYELDTILKNSNVDVQSI
ncbi:unnamed protein product [Schistosoma turkestanicum]|nr:unnamed protein product [Schistosoma turkestanicum]